jgi:hypothetical protein
MSTIAATARPAPPMRSVPADRGPSISRLTAIELRKMSDTRAGWWLELGVLTVMVITVIVTCLAGHPPQRTFQHILGNALIPAAILLPIVGMLLVTSEVATHHAHDLRPGASPVTCTGREGAGGGSRVSRTVRVCPGDQRRQRRRVVVRSSRRVDSRRRGARPVVPVPRDQHDDRHRVRSSPARVGARDRGLLRTTNRGLGAHLGGRRAQLPALDR